MSYVSTPPRNTPSSRYKQHGDTESADKLMKIIRQFLDREMVELDEELAECLPKSLADIPSDPGLGNDGLRNWIVMMVDDG
jgi:hypothetical protein